MAAPAGVLLGLTRVGARHRGNGVGSGVERAIGRGPSRIVRAGGVRVQASCVDHHPEVRSRGARVVLHGRETSVPLRDAPVLGWLFPGGILRRCIRGRRRPPIGRSAGVRRCTRVGGDAGIGRRRGVGDSGVGAARRGLTLSGHAVARLASAARPAAPTVVHAAARVDAAPRAEGGALGALTLSATVTGLVAPAGATGATAGVVTALAAAAHGCALAGTAHAGLIRPTGVAALAAVRGVGVRVHARGATLADWTGALTAHIADLAARAGPAAPAAAITSARHCACSRS